MIKLIKARKAAVVLGATALAALGAGGAALASSGGGEDEQLASGPQADQARSAALQVTGGGAANSVERDSENGATWEVEVTKPDGNTVDVRLDAGYRLVVVEGDGEAHHGAS